MRPPRAHLIAIGQAEKVSNGHTLSLTCDLTAHGLQAIENVVNFRGLGLARLANLVE